VSADGDSRTMSNERREVLGEIRIAAMQCFGTARIFERQAKKLKTRLACVTVLGLGVPILVGFAVSIVGPTSPLWPYVLWSASVLGLAQSILSLLSLVQHWDSEYAHAVTSKATNDRLAQELREFSKRQALTDEAFNSRYAVLKAQCDTQSMEDEKRVIHTKERRRAHRETLYNFRHACGTCGKTPSSLTPADCDSCGNY